MALTLPKPAAIARRPARPEVDLVVLGLNLHGLRLARTACRAGLKVAGYDSDSRMISQLKIGETILRRGFEPTDDIEILAAAHAVAVCPTVSTDPAGGYSVCDLDQLRDLSRKASDALRPGMLVVLEAPSHPGIVSNIFLPTLERNGMVAGEDFNAAYSPTADRLGFTPDFGARKAVTGVTPACARRVADLYEEFFGTVSVIDLAQAEKRRTDAPISPC